MPKERKKTRRTMSQQIENINKEMEITKRDQKEILELKSTVTEIKILLEKTVLSKI